MTDKEQERILQGVMGNYLQMPYNKYLWLRLEFMAICNDEIEAKIMRVVEYEIEGDRDTWLKHATKTVQNGNPCPPAPEQWWVSLSYKQFINRMYGTVKNEKTIISKLDDLVNKKNYLVRRTDPDHPYGSPQYTINRDVVQEKLNLLPSLPLVPDIQKLYGIVTTPVPASGTPPGTSDYHPPVPANGTPGTSDYHPPVPASGGREYQPVVLNKNSKNSKENDKNSSYKNNDANLTAADSLLEKLSLEDLIALKGQIDVLLTQQQSAPDQQPQLLEEIPGAAAAVVQNDQNSKEEVEDVEVQSQPERPGEDAPRTAETVVQLVEFLRGQRFEEQRGRQLRDAQIVLNLDPPLSLQEIEEAWTHGSDDYWRERDPLGMAVSDLRNLEKSSGKHRVIACLEHKRQEERRKARSNGSGGSRRQRQQSSVIVVPKAPQQSLTEEQAQALAALITQDGSAQGYDLRGTATQITETSAWKVVVSWTSPYWKGNLGLEVMGEKQWRKEFRELQDVIRVREARRHAKEVK